MVWRDDILGMGIAHQSPAARSDQSKCSAPAEETHWHPYWGRMYRRLGGWVHPKEQSLEAVRGWPLAASPHLNQAPVGCYCSRFGLETQWAQWAPRRSRCFSARLPVHRLSRSGGCQRCAR
eukprot:8453720-Pyramimonas_sp.AAC.1